MDHGDSLAASSMQAVGPATVNTRRPTLVRRCRGTMSWWRLAERSRWRLTASVVDLQQSTRYWGALPRRHRWTVTPSLNWRPWGMSSQWSSQWSRCVKRPRSNLWVPLTTRAAAFSTRWRRSVLAFWRPGQHGIAAINTGWDEGWYQQLLRWATVAEQWADKWRGLLCPFPWGSWVAI